MSITNFILVANDNMENEQPVHNYFSNHPCRKWLFDELPSSNQQCNCIQLRVHFIRLKSALFRDRSQRHCPLIYATVPVMSNIFLCRLYVHRDVRLYSRHGIQLIRMSNCLVDHGVRPSGRCFCSWGAWFFNNICRRVVEALLCFFIRIS